MSDTETYYTAAKLAGLPGMPTTVKQVIEHGKQGKIKGRNRKNRDGSVSKFLEYALSSLPKETRKHLATQNTKVGYEDAPAVQAAATRGAALKQEADQAEQLRREARAESLLMFGRLPAWKQKAARAKLAVIQAAQTYIEHHQLPRTAGQQGFCNEYNLDRIDVAPWVRREIIALHPATLRSWIADERELGMMGLVPLYGNRKDQSKIETWQKTILPGGIVKAPMADALVALMLQYPWIKEKKANESLRATLPEAPRVSDKSVKRYMNKWKEQNKEEFALATNPDDHKNRFQPAFGSRSEGIERPNQRWEIDATPADLLLEDGRHKIIGIIDVGPRRPSLYVTKTEKARDVCHVIRRQILAWGVPANGEIRTDQGSVFKTETFQGYLRDLEVDLHMCNPYSGDEKPFIERLFRTFSHDLVEVLPGYIGHNVSERQAIEARKSFAERLRDPKEIIEISMTAEQLQAFCDRWCKNQLDRKHSELGCTPNEALSRSTQPIHRITDERALDFLLLEVARRGNRLPIIGKRGIRVAHGRYIHETLALHIGKHCRAFEDPADLGRIVVQVQNEHGIWQFLCIAEDPDRTGISRAEVASIARHLANEHKKEMARHSREAKKALNGVNLVEAVLAYREQEAAAAKGNLVDFPRPTIDYTTPGLVAASAAADALEELERDPVDLLQEHMEEAKEQFRQYMEEAKQSNVVPLPTAKRPLFGTDLEKYRWLKANPLLNNADDAAWIAYYEQTTEYQLIFGETQDQEQYY